MKQKTNIFIIVLAIILGSIFLFSAYAKAVPNLQNFEYTISSQLGFSKLFTAIVARFFIGLEAAIGLLLLAQIFGKKNWVLKLYLFLLLAFSIHLIILWINMGNDVDCGCMGSLVPMTPSVSLLKNLALMIGGAVLLYYYSPSKNKKRTVELEDIIHERLNAPAAMTAPKTMDSFAIGTILVAIAAFFIVFPMKVKERLSIEKLYTQTTDSPKTDLREGKHVVCFMSLTCGHCRDAAILIHDIHNNNPSLPFYFIFPKGESDSLQQIAFDDFMRETKDADIPYHFIDRNLFGEMLLEAGENGVPSIFWIENGVMVRKLNGHQINQQDIEQWIHK